jgi:Putative beta-barrel porin-2, OmpL-like. bbp2
MFKRKLLHLTIASALSASCLFAQTSDTTKSTSLNPDSIGMCQISGQVDVYFRSSKAYASALTAYGKAANSIGLGLANVVVAKNAKKVSFTADVIFRPRSEPIHYNPLAMVKQLFVSYKPTDKVTLTMGSFMSFIGYEYTEASNNLNYSMSYAFSYSPMSPTGFKADIRLPNHFSLMVGIFEPLGNRFYNPIKGENKWNIGAQLGYAHGNFSIYGNVLSGKTHNSLALNQSGVDTTTSNIALFDMIANYQIIPKMGLGINIFRQTVQHSESKINARKTGTSYVLYLNYAATPKCLFAARAEYFDDASGALSFGSKVNAFTLSSNFKIDALTVIPEIRFDYAKEALFNGQKSEVACILAAIYKF